MEKCCGEVVLEKCCGQGLQRSVVEKCCGGVVLLLWRGGVFCGFVFLWLCLVVFLY